MKISDLTRSDKGKLEAVCAVLAVMLAMGVALISCSDDVSARGIGASRAAADATDRAIEGTDAPAAVDAVDAEDDPTEQQTETAEPADDETISHESVGSVNPASVESGQPASSPSRSESKSETNPNTSAPAQGATQRKWVEDTEQVWVVNKTAWTESVPVYTTVEVSICSICGQEITGNTTAHGKAHMKAGEGSGHHSEVRQLITSYSTVSHPEEGHWETRAARSY